MIMLMKHNRQHGVEDIMLTPLPITNGAAICDNQSLYKGSGQTCGGIMKHQVCGSINFRLYLQLFPSPACYTASQEHAWPHMTGNCSDHSNVAQYQLACTQVTQKISTYPSSNGQTKQVISFVQVVATHHSPRISVTVRMKFLVVKTYSLQMTHSGLWSIQLEG